MSQFSLVPFAKINWFYFSIGHFGAGTASGEAAHLESAFFCSTQRVKSKLFALSKQVVRAPNCSLHGEVFTTSKLHKQKKKKKKKKKKKRKVQFDGALLHLSGLSKTSFGIGFALFAKHIFVIHSRAILSQQRATSIQLCR
jgi:hypothetical protein